MTVAESAFADTAPADPTAPSSPATVSADALPTVQINGVVWSQTIVGNTVYAGGDFTTAQPAGSAAGANTVSRTYVLSYNLTTGVLNTAFAPVLNGQVKSVAASPDGSRIYIGGQFTTVNGVNRYRIAALDPTTGAVITTFNAGTNATVNAITATNSTVFLGGAFSSVGKDVRNKVAAVTAATGSNTAFDPNAQGGSVTALVVSPDGSKVIVGGNFTTLGGSSNPGYGLGEVDANSGAMLPYPVNNLIRNGGSQSSIESLSTDGDSVYGSGYVYGSGGNLEGSFRSDWNGNLTWVEDCHGDTYSQASNGTALYVAGHPHYCGNIGGFQNTSPSWTFHRAIAFSKAATQTIGTDPGGYYNFAGTPAPTLLNWYPDFNVGTYTGQSQGPWSVAANSNYVVYGGEFTTVNGVRQQGLVRFAVRALAPNKMGPLYSGGTFKPSVVSLASGTARVSWTANADRDNENLTYNVYRNGNLTTPVYTTTAASSVWNQPAMGFTDTGLTPGATYSYRIRATDPLGNTVIGDGVSVTVTSATPSTYSSAVSADTPTDFWRLGEASGSTVYDWAGYSDQIAGSGVTRGTAGAIGGDSNTASTFSGASDASGISATQSLIDGPQVFSIEAWFKTTTTAGGKIVGFGNANTGNSSNYDRHIYMDTSGNVNFGVYPGSSRVLTSPTALNDGQWHQVVGTLGPTGMQLFVDGIRVGNRTDTTSAQPYQGYWRIGGDSSWSGGNYFAGAIDDVSIYSQPLSKQQVDAHWVASGRTSKLPQPPADNYGNRIFTDAPSLYWRLDDSGSTAADSSPSAAPGNYFGGYTQGVAGALANNPDTATMFDGQSGGVSSAQQYNDPEIYSVEAWFKTTTTVGGKIIGFGSSPSGTSGSYDRHVYMQNNGQLVFGTYTGQLNTITTPGSYNDGLWHHVVGTQSSDGLKLYVDGALMGTNGATSAQPYTGYWRVGGDTTWGSSSAFFAGTIDEAAVYDTALPAATVSQHYALGTATPANVAPTASFTQTVTNLSVAFDGSASADSDGSIASYAWNFGDGGTDTSKTPTHVYAAAGTYTVTLTVTDNKGATGVFTQSVTAVAPHVNVAPTASFTNSINHLALTVDGTGSSDSDGTVASYLWNFGDGGSATTATGTHTYATAGTYQVKLTVTDNSGATGTSTTSVTAVAAPPPNVPPTASFTSGHTDLTATFDASGSTDSDGTIASYAWKFGDGATATGVTASHAYASAGTYSVTLTVTDNQGATGTSTASVMVTAPVVVNKPPTAAIASTVTNLSVALDASASADTDGTITGYAWNFGDTTTGTGKTVSHSYTSAGTYTVTLTVTDNGGATGTATATVTTTAPPATPFALDSFTRTVANGFGTADVGGAWTRWGAASNLSVGGGSGTVLLSTPGAQAGASMDSVVQQDTDLRVQFSVDKAATGGGTYLYATGRKVSANNEYRASIHLKNNGTVAVGLVALKGSATGVTLVNEVVVPGTIVAGTALSIRLQVTGTNPTTIKAKVWVAGTQEPTAWTVQATDTYAGLQAPGGIGVIGYLSGSATNAPQNLSVQELSAFKP
ncbi:PKD domain-containing protein [Subtercola lobariae]|uniref:PDK repeat-containing protein n=1 Tax=Subtercola lobariae TaxID=1588641 RepID=A0A917B123_9MICO|nr:PKD domain-containing protein [Subtercola lobariae]GGF13826.1 PDK repeat-containing protein [Subtercola lobariae]